MKSNEPFNYIIMRPYLRTRLNEVMQKIEKLNISKQNYSIQELQSLDVLDQSQIQESKRILQEADKFLTSAGDLRKLIILSKNDPRNEFRENLIERNLDEEIDVDLSDLQRATFTITDISFKANKYTKILCEKVLDLITKGYNRDENKSFRKVLNRLRLIYKKANTENAKKVNVLDELKALSKDLEGEEYKGWDADIQANKADNYQILQSLYNELIPVWNVEDVLYEIKSQLNKQLLRCLIKDNYTNFKNWGFRKDENGKWVLNFDSEEVLQRYAFHVPNLSKITSRGIGISIKSFRKFKYPKAYTSSVRKNTRDKISRTKLDIIRFFRGNKNRFISLLENVDFEHDRVEDYEAIQELEIMVKIMTEDNFNRLVKEHPEISDKVEKLRQIIFPQNINTCDEETLQELGQSTEYEENMREQIEQNLATYKTIFVQYGNNLDKNASIYALRKHMRDKFGITDIKVVQINAGEKKAGKGNEGLIIDGGDLVGNNNFSYNYLGTKTINANSSIAQKSACGVLKQFGIYVPSKIVQYADAVLSDERILDARYGVNLARNLSNKALFEFAESKRDDGTYLIESDLTNEELKEWNLEEQYKKREEEIQEAINEIKDNIFYTIDANGQERYIAVVNKHLNCGAMVSYSLGCDYYLSIADTQPNFADAHQDFLKEDESSIPKVTFAITANPKKGNGKLPDSIIKWCENLRDNGENDTMKIITVRTSIKYTKAIYKANRRYGCIWRT